MDERRFSNRHYEVLAEAVRTSNVNYALPLPTQFAAVLAAVLEADSPYRFDRERFLKACQPDV